MDWDKLKIFHAVAEAGSFTNATVNLNLSQSAISRQIQALEQDLKVQLFERHARGLTLTENGEYVIFVDNSFPGQTVKARIAKKKKRYAEAKLIDVTKRSDVEVLSDFQEISGGPYIYVPIELQEKEKKP